jgi:hypothetical protein
METDQAQVQVPGALDDNGGTEQPSDVPVTGMSADQHCFIIVISVGAMYACQPMPWLSAAAAVR